MLKGSDKRHKTNMATASQTTKKKKKKFQNGLPMELFTRLRFIIAFENDSTQPDDATASLLDSYSPRVVGSCTLAWQLPKDPLAVEKYRECMAIPGPTPYYDPPSLPSLLPPESSQNCRVTYPTHSSTIPILMTAFYANIDVRNYNFVGGRYAFRRIATNDEDFVITIKRFGPTVYLRSYTNYQGSNKNDPGYRFEQMCTTTNENLASDYYQLIDGRVGEFRILLLGEIDAIRRDNGESIELKYHRGNLPKSKQHDWWSQIFLSGINTIINGRYLEANRSQILHLRECHASELSSEQAKIETFQRLYRVLQFLLSNVAEERLYMFCGLKDEATKIRSMHLHEVVNGRDKQTLTFINENLLGTLTVNA